MGTGAVATSGFEILDLWHSEKNCCYKLLFLNIREWHIISWFAYFYYRYLRYGGRQLYYVFASVNMHFTSCHIEKNTLASCCTALLYFCVLNS